MSLLLNARFADTVARLSQLDRANPHGLPEVAFVGRSNAGKSSCINTLCNQKRLAFSSRTPGRTQALNLFAVGPVKAPQPVGFLVDTPGYGFATASPQAKASWQKLAGDYITRRQALNGVVLMVDIRRGLTDLDRQLLAWTPSVLPLIVVLTKADKLSRQQALKVSQQLAADPLLRDREAPVLLQQFSILSRAGTDALRQAIDALLTEGAHTWPAVLAGHKGATAPVLIKRQGAEVMNGAPTEAGDAHTTDAENTSPQAAPHLPEAEEGGLLPQAHATST